MKKIYLNSISYFLTLILLFINTIYTIVSLYNQANGLNSNEQSVILLSYFKWNSIVVFLSIISFILTSELSFFSKKSLQNNDINKTS